MFSFFLIGNYCKIKRLWKKKFHAWLHLIEAKNDELIEAISEKRKKNYLTIWEYNILL